MNITPYTIDISDPYRPTIPTVTDTVLDFAWDWTEYLADIGASISSVEVVGFDGIVVSNVSTVGAVVTAFITTPKKPTSNAYAMCTITTTGTPSRKESRKIYFDFV